MASVSYIIRSEKKGGLDVPIWVLIRSTVLNVKTSTKIKVPFNLWDSKRQCLKPYRDKPTEIITRLDRISNELQSLKSYLIDVLDSKENISKEELKTEVETYLYNKRNPKEEIKYNLNAFIDLVITQMKSGERLAKGKRYSPGSIKTWNSFRKMFLNFQTEYIRRSLDFDDIDMPIYSLFIQYCYSRDYTAETTKKYITVLIASLSYAVNDGYSKNEIYRNKDFTKNVQKAEGKKPYLTEEEIERIYSLDIKDKTLLKVRDVFIIGCYCGQRVSDYNNIKKDDIIKLSNGKRAFSITQQKTKTRVVVPFISGNIEVILKRWNYELPKLSDVVINRDIKKICRQADITSPFVSEVVKGGVLTKSIVEKCDLITTHTARRSAITNLYKKNILNDRELRSISGHKTDKSFEQYICLSTEEQAEKIAYKLGLTEQIEREE